MHYEELQRRREVALAQLDAFIDVSQGWRCRFEDDDWKCSIAWISDVIGKTSDYENGGHLETRDREPALAWKIENGRWYFGSLDKSYKSIGHPWDLTRKQFRDLAKRNNVSLPSIHSTLWLRELPARRAEIVRIISELRYSWKWVKCLFQHRHDGPGIRANVFGWLAVCKLHRQNLDLKIKQLPSSTG